MNKNLVIIDGSNFYHRAKHLAPNLHLSNLDYRKLAELFTGKLDANVFYCIGEIKRGLDEKSRDLYSKQQALFHHLQKQQVVVKKGFLLKNNGVYQEKGVDVRMAVDIVRGAVKDEYDVCFLVSSDSDLLPAVDNAVAAGKKIMYVAFEGSMVSKALAIHSSSVLFITKSMLEQCVSGV